MGSGKSAVGRALADRLSRPCLDLDRIVVDAAGRSIPEIFATEGESGFRARERDALVEALSGPPSVIATGGGVVVADGNRSVLGRAGAAVVWLDADLDVLEERVGDGTGRPMLAGGVADGLAATVRRRRPFYDEVASVRVDTTRGTPDQVVERVVAALGAGADR